VRGFGQQQRLVSGTGRDKGKLGIKHLGESAGYPPVCSACVCVGGGVLEAG
jgi:hypothetical protein